MRSTRPITLALFAVLFVGALSAMSTPPGRPVPKGIVFIRVSGGALKKPIIIANTVDVSIIENGLYIDNSAPRIAAANVPPLQLAFFWRFKYGALDGSLESLAQVNPDSANMWADFQPAAMAGDPGVVTYRARTVRSQHDGKTMIETWGDGRVGQPWVLAPWAVAALERYVKANR